MGELETLSIDRLGQSHCEKENRETLFDFKVPINNKQQKESYSSRSIDDRSTIKTKQKKDVYM